MKKIAQLLRTYIDEDGVHQWWTNWQDCDAVVGEAEQNGVRLVMVDHRTTRKALPWSKPKTAIRRAYYAPDEIRYAVEQK